MLPFAIVVVVYCIYCVAKDQLVNFFNFFLWKVSKFGAQQGKTPQRKMRRLGNLVLSFVLALLKPVRA